MHILTVTPINSKLHVVRSREMLSAWGSRASCATATSGLGTQLRTLLENISCNSPPSSFLSRRRPQLTGRLESQPRIPVSSHWAPKAQRARPAGLPDQDRRQGRKSESDLGQERILTRNDVRSGADWRGACPPRSPQSSTARLDLSRKKRARVPISLWLDGSCACTDITDKCLNCMQARTGPPSWGRQTLFLLNRKVWRWSVGAIGILYSCFTTATLLVKNNFQWTKLTRGSKHQWKKTRQSQRYRLRQHLPVPTQCRCKDCCLRHHARALKVLVVGSSPKVIRIRLSADTSSPTRLLILVSTIPMYWKCYWLETYSSDLWLK